MSDSQPTAEQPSPDPTPDLTPEPTPQPVAAEPAPRVVVRLRDQVFGIRSLVAVGLAGVVLGGLGGFGIHAATDGDGDGRMGRFGPGEGFRGGPGGFPPGPGQMGPGQMGPGQMGPGQMGPGQMGPGQLGPGQMGPGQMGPGQPGPGGQQLPPQGQPSATPTAPPTADS